MALNIGNVAAAYTFKSRVEMAFHICREAPVGDQYLLERNYSNVGS
jgi:hypothetical protein